MFATLATAVITRVWKAHAGGLSVTLLDWLNGGAFHEQLQQILSGVFDPTLASALAVALNYIAVFAVTYFFPANK